MENERRLLAIDELWRGPCGLGRHQNTAVGREVGGSKGRTDGRRHRHVGVVGDERGMGTDPRVHGNHPLLLHELRHGQLVGLLGSPPLGSAILKPHLQRGQKW